MFGRHRLHAEIDHPGPLLVSAGKGLNHTDRVASIAAVPPERKSGVFDLVPLAFDDFVQAFLGVGAHLHVQQPVTRFNDWRHYFASLNSKLYSSDGALQ